MMAIPGATGNNFNEWQLRRYWEMMASTLGATGKTAVINTCTVQLVHLKHWGDRNTGNTGATGNIGQLVTRETPGGRKYREQW